MTYLLLYSLYSFITLSICMSIDFIRCRQKHVQCLLNVDTRSSAMTMTPHVQIHLCVYSLFAVQFLMQ